MPNKIIGDLTTEVQETKTVMASATKLINGLNDRIKAAVDKALENGASAEELAPLTDLTTELTAEEDALSAAVAANTETPPVASTIASRAGLGA